MSLSNGDDILVDGLPYSVQNANRGWSLAQTGNGALRFELRHGDVWYQDTSSKERTEVRGEDFYTAGKEIRISYDFAVEPGSPNTSDWLVIGQLHAIDDFSSPILAVEMVGEYLSVRLRNRPPGEDFQTWEAFRDDQTITRGKYYHIDIVVHMHLDSNGSADVWLDGDHVVDYDGAIGYGYGVYWKEGIYREEAPETIAVTYKNLAITGKIGIRIFGTSEKDIIAPGHTLDGQPKQTDLGDVIYGLGKGDKIRGGPGDDLIFGGPGKDVLKGGRGDDTLVGGPGNDKLKGGPGQDVFRFEDDFGRGVIRDFQHGKDLIAIDGDLFQSEAAAVDAMTNRHGDAILKVDGSKMVIKDFNHAQFHDHSDDFIFV
ncbi:MAG: heparin lyase I family protein [Bauldia sp.]|nr:heparin lyase I family protein [Bauldia sp.]